MENMSNEGMKKMGEKEIQSMQEMQSIMSNMQDMMKEMMLSKDMSKMPEMMSTMGKMMSMMSDMMGGGKPEVDEDKYKGMSDEEKDKMDEEEVMGKH